MTRTQTIDKMIKKAKAITGTNSKNWTRDAENKIWDMAYDWNSNHDDSEIFMCEIWKDDGYDFDGFMIEDDYFVYED